MWRQAVANFAAQTLEQLYTSLRRLQALINEHLLALSGQPNPNRALCPEIFSAMLGSKRDFIVAPSIDNNVVTLSVTHG